MRRYLEALKIFGAIGDMESTARIYNNIGVSFLRRNQYDRSLEFFEKCVAVSRKIGHAFLEGWALFNAAEDLAHLGNIQKAILYADQSLEIYKRLGDSLGLSGVYSAYAIISWKQKDYTRSRERFDESIDLRRKLKMPYRLANACLECGEMLAEKGDPEDAREYVEEALDIYDKIGQVEMADRARKLLASL
jgi:tetratricopeptide (TPR) repeat protein